MGESAKNDRLRVVIDQSGGRKIIDPEPAGHVEGHEPPPGRSIEDLTAEAGTQQFLVMPVISGSQDTLDGRAGGREVTTSELKFKGGPLVMTGQFPEGAHVRVIMEFEVQDVDFKLIKHQGSVVGKKRVHTAELVGYDQVPAKGNLMELADRINNGSLETE